MLLFLRSSSTLRNSFIRPATFSIVPAASRTMSLGGTGSAHTEDLTASKLFNVKGYTAVVTGGGTGIGLMITQALIANGAKVYITGRREEALKQVEKKYSPEPGRIISLPGDITSKDDIKAMANEVAKKEPNGVHLLVNNAGIATDQNTRFSNAEKPDFKDGQSISDYLWKSDPAHWAATFQTNITAQFFVAAAFLPLLTKARESTPGFSSSIVNITSISGVMKGTSSGQFAYATSKAGLIHLTKMMATTFAECKVRVNSIAPGLFPSEMTAGDSNEMQKSKLEDEQLSNPAGRPGHDADMASCILFLASPAGNFLNAQILYPDGGMTLIQPASN